MTADNENEHRTLSKAKKVAVAGAVLSVLIGALIFLQRSSVLPGDLLSATSDEWALNQTTNALDGETYSATRSFDFPEQRSRIDVSLTCIVKTRDIKIAIESYGDKTESGQNEANEFVTEMRPSRGTPQPVGRLKIANAEPVPLFLYFFTDRYSNVMYWNVRTSAQDALTQDAYKARNGAAVGEGRFQSLLEEGKEKVGAGNYLSTHLPLVVEVQNTGGTEVFTIPNDSISINTVIDKCTTRDVPSYKALAVAPPPSESSGDSNPSQVARFINDLNFSDHEVAVLNGEANYAGSMKVTERSCGTDCRIPEMTDLRSGEEHSFPVGGEDNWKLSLTYKPNSNLLRAQWSDTKDEKTVCIRAYYSWTGTFSLIQRDELVGECPEEP